MAAPVFYAAAYGVCLQKLRKVQQIAEILRQTVILRQIGQNFAVGRFVALMAFHHGGEDVAVARLGKGFNGRPTGEGLKAEFRHIAIQMVSVGGKRLFTVPYIPIMYVAPIFVGG